MSPSLARSSSASFKIFTAGQTPGFPAYANVIDIARASDGTMWFTDLSRNDVRKPGIGRIASDGTFTEFTDGLPRDAKPYSIAAGPDGNMWFSDWRGVVVGKITPQGLITEYAASGHAHRHAKGIAFGRGGEPWILADDEQSGNYPPLLAHVTRKGTVETQPLPGGMDAEVGAALTADVDGNVWFIGLTPNTRRGELVEHRGRSGGFLRRPLDMLSAALPCCPNVAPKSVAIGADGNPWFTTLYLIYKNSPHKYLGTLKAGQVNLYPLRRGGLPYVAYPSALALGTDGFWVAGSEPNADAGGLWHFDSRRGQIVYVLPHAPLALAVDAAGNPWFTTRFRGEPSRIIEVLTH